MSAKRRKAKDAVDAARGPGKAPLVVGEETQRATVNLPESLFERAERKAGKRGMSAYLRALVERDLKRAS